MSKIADATIKTLPLPATGNRIYYDPKTPGFGVRLTVGGAIAFVLNYRTKAGRERRITIGKYPNWNTTAARAEAQRLRRLVDQGQDPLGEIEALREAPTVADLIARFDAEHIARLRKSTAKNYRTLIRKHIAPFFGAHTKVADVQHEDIDELHRKISSTGSRVIANRVVAMLSTMFGLAIRWRMIESNPVKGVPRNTESPRQRYLSDDEMASLVESLAAYPDKQIVAIIRMLLLTGSRSGEIFAMRWDGIDLAAGTWSKASAATKQKRNHLVPLSTVARQVLAGLPRTSEWVFPSNDSDTGHIVNIYRSWHAICRRAGIKQLKPHDLRHQFASQLVSGGANLPLVGALLGHSSPQTTARYSHLFLNPQKAAVERVAAAIENAGKPAAEPIPLRR